MGIRGIGWRVLTPRYAGNLGKPFLFLGLKIWATTGGLPLRGFKIRTYIKDALRSLSALNNDRKS
ncbi:hypothetical protein TUMEXPCC7403_15995 [Tumidithrix helvetica PCC 7403]